MVEAFGAYTDNVLHPMPEPIHPHDKVVLVGAALAALALLFIWICA